VPVFPIVCLTLTQARSVEAVAHLAGFADVNTFIRAFAREYGTTPAKWRRERQG
jgi:AraC-like DNA-binding protein